MHIAVCSAIRLPESKYPLWDALPPDIIKQGKLSQLQLEGVLYACTKHQQFLPTGERAPLVAFVTELYPAAPSQEACMHVLTSGNCQPPEYMKCQ